MTTSGRCIKQAFSSASQHDVGRMPPSFSPTEHGGFALRPERDILRAEVRRLNAALAAAKAEAERALRSCAARKLGYDA